VLADQEGVSALACALYTVRMAHSCVLLLDRSAALHAQAVGAGVQSAQLMAERDRAVEALGKAKEAAAAAQQDAARCGWCCV
jgi:hypothetical protein